VEECPHGRFSVGQGGDGVFRDTHPGKGVARRTGGRIKAWAQTIDYNDRHLLGYFSPLLPAVKTPQVVRAHDPDKPHTRASGQQPRYRIVSVPRLNDSFETRDIDTRMMRKGACRGDSFGQRREPVGVLERVPRCHQPPDTIQLESLECEQGRSEMSLMWRIERAAKQANPHAGRMWWQ
jgi:hypothetical protein